MTSKEQKDIFISAALDMIGVRFSHAGRSREGVDCLGLIVLAGKKADMDISDTLLYSRIINPTSLLNTIAQNCYNMTMSNMLPGDVIVFSIGTSPQHMGILTKPEWFIHSSGQSRLGVVEQRLAGYWFDRIHSVWRWREWPV